MSYQPTFTCDICGAVKQETNHWLTAYTSSDGDVSYEPWQFRYAICGNRTHLCGSTCVATHLTRYLASLKEKSA